MQLHMGKYGNVATEKKISEWFWLINNRIIEVFLTRPSFSLAPLSQYPIVAYTAHFVTLETIIYENVWRVWKNCAQYDKWF